MRGGFSAFFWQNLGRLFGMNLKAQYDVLKSFLGNNGAINLSLAPVWHFVVKFIVPVLLTLVFLNLMGLLT